MDQRQSQRLKDRDALASEAFAGERSETAKAGEASAAAPDPEVPAKPKRRQFSASYKARILDEVDRCNDSGEVGRMLRREGLYSSHLTAWRKARRDGGLSALAPNKRGRKPAPRNPLEKKVERLERDNARLHEDLRKARTIIDVQGKVAGLLGISFDSEKSS